MSGVKKNASVIRIGHSRYPKVWRVKGKGSLGGKVSTNFVKV